MSSYYYGSDDPHHRSKARIQYNTPYCQGHPITTYGCGAMCHDCGWGGCGCFTMHCCCQGPDDQNDQHEKQDDRQSDEENDINPTKSTEPTDMKQEQQPSAT